MSENKSWSEIGKDISENIDRISIKLNSKNISDDLKANFKETIGQAINVINQIIKNIEATVTDEEIKSETKKIFKDIVNEFESSVRQLYIQEEE